MGNKLVIGLDVGDRRIGIALGSTIARIASAHSFVDRQNTDYMQVLEEVMKGQEVEAIIVGLPRDINGNETAQTVSCREFAAELASRTNVPVVLQDESTTSLLAEKRLKERGKPYVKGDIDAEAAALILQDYLNTKAGHTA